MMTKFVGMVFVLAFLAAGGWAQASPDEDYRRGWAAYKGDDIVGAMMALRVAADTGHAKAQALLGYILDKSSFTQEAHEFYVKAAEQGEGDAMYWLGVMYIKGNDAVKKDLAKAREWIEKSAERDNSHAMATLAASYRDGGLGLAKDPEKAAVYEARAKILKERNAGTEIGLGDPGDKPASGM